MKPTRRRSWARLVLQLLSMVLMSLVWAMMWGYVATVAVWLLLGAVREPPQTVLHTRQSLQAHALCNPMQVLDPDAFLPFAAAVVTLVVFAIGRLRNLSKTLKQARSALRQFLMDKLGQDLGTAMIASTVNPLLEGRPVRQPLSHSQTHTHTRTHTHLTPRPT